MPRARSRSSASARLASSRASPTSSRAPPGRGRSAPRPCRGPSQRDEPRLRAVVQVALDPLQLGRGGVDGAGAGARSSSLHAGAQRGLARGPQQRGAELTMPSVSQRGAKYATGARRARGRWRGTPRRACRRGRGRSRRRCGAATSTTRAANRPRTSPRSHRDRHDEPDRAHEAQPAEVLPALRVAETRAGGRSQSPARRR